MANIFSNFGTKVGNAFTNLGQGGNLFNANPTEIAALSEEDRRRLKREGLERFANSLGVAAAIGSGDPQRMALAQNKMRQAKIDKENARAKAEQEVAINEYFGGNEDLLKFAKTFGTSAALQRQQNLQSGEIAAMAEQRRIQSLIKAGYTPEQANAIVVGGLKADEVKNLNVSSGQSIIDEINNTVAQETKDSGTQNDYANLDQAFGPIDTAQEVLLNKPLRTLFGADPAGDTAAAIRDKESLNLEILATLAADYEGKPNVLLLKEIKKNIPEGSLTSEADAYQRYSNFLNRTRTRINYLEQGILSDTVSDATKEKYRIELVKAKTLKSKLDSATASLAPKDSVSVEADTNFVSEGKYNNYFTNKGNDF